MSERIERISSVVLAAASLLAAATFAHREFASSNRAQNVASPAPLQYVPTWKEFSKSGWATGDTAATIKIIEFADFECPFCKIFDRTMRSVVARYGSDVERIFVSFPLPMHKYAFAASRAAACADRQHRFSAMHDILFDKQDSLGVKAWLSYAKDAHVPDASEFATCMIDSTSGLAADNGSAVARALQLRKTPTVILNGWMFPAPPSVAVLTKAIDALREHTRAHGGSTRPVG